MGASFWWASEVDAGLEPFRLLDHEARALLSRLERVKSFALQETMVPAAAISDEAQTAIERFLVTGRRRLRPDPLAHHHHRRVHVEPCVGHIV